MKIGELSHRIFSFIKAKFSSIATLRFKILTKIKGKRHGSKFAFHTGWSINTNKSKQYKEILIELLGNGVCFTANSRVRHSYEITDLNLPGKKKWALC